MCSDSLLLYSESRHGVKCFLWSLYLGGPQTNPGSRNQYRLNALVRSNGFTPNRDNLILNSRFDGRYSGDCLPDEERCPSEHDREQSSIPARRDLSSRACSIITARRMLEGYFMTSRYSRRSKMRNQRIRLLGCSANLSTAAWGTVSQRKAREMTNLKIRLSTYECGVFIKGEDIAGMVG
ncbi:hypothetical protein C8J56DRAFT_153446 [Mycena floridula]|nr:hypothetical protein C8J56DRAFT_153446 [Mycena floridula]